MPKKKAKPSTAKASRKSHGELFDKHPNLIWLLPIFLLIAAIAVIVYNNSLTPVTLDGMLNASDVPQVNIESTGSADTTDLQ